MDAATQDSASPDEFLAMLESVAADGARPDFKESVGKAAGLFDEAAVEPRCDALLARLSENAGDVRALETLVVLGLARPEVFERRRIPVLQEARRLAVLLERGGESERAQAVLELLLARKPSDRGIERELSSLMRRNGNLSRLVERHLARADECVRAGRRDEAVRWLREVLMLDPQRRDVARMIRDLNYADLERRGAWRKGAKAAAVALLCMSGLSGVVWRETSIDERFERIPQAPNGDMVAMQARLSALDDLVSESPLWLGLFEVSRERASLRESLERMRAERAEQAAKEAQARTLATTLAESQYALAQLAARQYDFDLMRDHLEAALSYAPADWKERASIQLELDALDEREQRKSAPPQGGSK
jgi:tetratricopeptide (TPR) repeat protein